MLKKKMTQNTNEMYAAIAMAIYELQGSMLHDKEAGILTIKPRKTAWTQPHTIISKWMI